MTKTIQHTFLQACYATIFLVGTSCKKFVEIPPPTDQISSERVFTNDGTATAAVVGIYSQMMGTQFQFSSSDVTLYTGLYADELAYFVPTDRDEFITSQLSPSSHPILSSGFWAPAYRYIYAANICLEKLEKSTTLTPAVRSTLIGEARFLRSFCFFHLVNLFGDVPLTLGSDYRINASMPRTSMANVYAQIIADLTAAKELLPATYTGTGRVRPNKWSASALLARVHLYNKNWTAAEAEAAEVIASGVYTLRPNLTTVFLANSTETIWQLQPVNTIWNTWEGKEILPQNSSTPPTYLLTNDLLSAFEPGDLRRTAWVGTRIFSGQNISYPAKYKVHGNGAPVTEYYMMLRYAEQFLIRSEARANAGNIASAQADLNVIRNRAGLSNTTSNSQATLIAAIEKERRLELFAEWGHRWYDLKRWNRASAVLAPLKTATWQDTDVLWHIPINQINANTALQQNPGY